MWRLLREPRLLSGRRGSREARRIQRVVLLRRRPHAPLGILRVDPESHLGPAGISRRRGRESQIVGDAETVNVVVAEPVHQRPHGYGQREGRRRSCVPSRRDRPNGCGPWSEGRSTCPGTRTGSPSDRPGCDQVVVPDPPGTSRGRRKASSTARSRPVRSVSVYRRGSRSSAGEPRLQLEPVPGERLAKHAALARHGAFDESRRRAPEQVQQADVVDPRSPVSLVEEDLQGGGLRARARGERQRAGAPVGGSQALLTRRRVKLPVASRSTTYTSRKELRASVRIWQLSE